MKIQQTTFLLLLFSSIGSALFSQTVPEERSIRFDSNWKFAFGNASDPSRDFNYGIATIFSKSGAAVGTAIDPKFSDSSWRTVQLPHDWAVELPFADSKSFEVMAHGYKPVGGLFPQTSIGWYRKHFSVPEADSGRRFVIQFDGIFRNAAVWVNGFYVGTNLSGYLGASYDITDYLSFKKENVVVVRVDATQYEGWFYEGAGIYRHVWLKEYNNIHLVRNEVFAYSRVEKNQATITIETPVQNLGLSTAGITVSAVLTDRDGNIKGQTRPQPLSLQVNEKKTIRQIIPVDNPRLWSIDNPYLYRIITLVKKQGVTIDSEKIRFGIRTIKISPLGLFVNGKYVKIQGVCCHQDHAGLGSALPDYLQYYRIRLLKDMGANAYRTSHNAPTPELLDACDSLGMLVLDEQRLLNSSPEYLGQFERLIKRDRNHPSVFLWSIGNEEGWIQTTSIGKRIAQTLITKQAELDPTRTCTYAADLGNVYQGINEVIPVRGFNYRISGIEPYHKDHPGQPILGTEMGSTVSTRGIYAKDTIHCYLPDEDLTAPWWANTAEQWWSLVADKPWMMGGFVWTGFDYRGEPTPFQWPNISSHFGIMDACGFPKNLYYYYQSWWTDKDVLHISPHWNWQGKEGQPIDVWVNSNADSVELFLNNRSLGQKQMPRNGHLEWSVKYEPGILKAVAHKKGRTFSATVETTGPAAVIVIAPSKTTMLGDGEDAAVLNISVVDKQGRIVPDADNLIHFSVTGNARIIGVGNGDPSSHEQDSFDDTVAERKLFNGKCQVILQAGSGKSMIGFKASSPGLYGSETGIEAIVPGTPHPVAQSGNTFPTATITPVKPGKMLGADISFLPQLEKNGMKFYDKGVEKDAITILKDHGFNYIRLRIFNNPARDSGYAPGQGFCDLGHTLAMAKRIKAAGLKFLLDFHYSDNWADPGKQFKPAAWRNEDFQALKQSVYDYTRSVMKALKEQGTLPDMVQVGNEINHGMIWPEGNIGNLDSLAQLIYAGINGVKAVSPGTAIMLHLALGGQNDEARFFLDNMLARGVPFDVIGLSYYPRWHGTLDDLKNNLDDLAREYKKDLIVVEYSQDKEAVNDIAFTVKDGRGKGTCIWEPLNTWERLFDKNGQATPYLDIYDQLHKKYISGN